MSFEEVVSSLEEIYPKVSEITAGKNADYIPELAGVNPNLFSIAACSVDGKRWSIGDDTIHFTFQSTVKPLLYCLAQALKGSGEVHEHIGHEPSGQRFNAFVLDEDFKPHNPMINAGAIMSAALIRSEFGSSVEAYKAIKTFVERCAGMTSPVNFDNTIYLSELNNAERNFALSYFMREKSDFLKHECDNMQSVLETYFQACSMTIDVRGMATIAATLAAGGICPVTKERVIKASHVRNALQLMYNCGMYDSSGRFSFEVGIPAKSGVSGSLMLAVTGRYGISVWSPPLDKFGNTVRGDYVCRHLVERFPQLHMFENAVRSAEKKTQKQEIQVNSEVMFIHAASHGDLETVKQIYNILKDPNVADYDGRTALHLAFAEGHENIATFLIQQGADVELKDRFGNTPRSEARKAGLLRLLGDSADLSDSESPTVEEIKQENAMPLARRGSVTEEDIAGGKRQSTDSFSFNMSQMSLAEEEKSQNFV